MFRYVALAAFSLAAAPAFAQNQTAPAESAPTGPSPEAIAAIQTANSAYRQCIQTGIMGVPATVTPEAGAATVLSGCATQRQGLETAAHNLIAMIPEGQRPMAEEQMRTQLAGVPALVAGGIQQMRAAPAPAPATAPAQ